MADTKLSNLTEVTTLSDTDEFYVNDGGTSKRLTKASLDDNIDIPLSQINDVTATKDEVNILDGVTATATEINLLDGVTASTAELNILDGVTATATEINILDGVTATTAELNVTDGITATAAEINHLDGITSTVTELNQLHGNTLSGNNTGDQTSVTGNAGTATKLETARTIDITGDITATAQPFDGSANIAISAAVNNDSHSHTDATLGMASSQAANGYVKLPDGTIIQWGTYSSTQDADETFNFPMTFPNSGSVIQLTMKDDDGNHDIGTGFAAHISSTSSFVVSRNAELSGTYALNITAVGY